MKTKGALIWEFNQPWSIEEIEIGDPVKDEVKIQMEAAGMCHSDHHLVTGGIPMGGFPVLGGHEGAGIVTEVGPGVEDIAPGDHVVLSFIPSCGQCPSCQAGLRNLCDLGAGLLNGAAVSDGTFRIQAKGQNVFPMTLLGTFSPYMVVHKSSVVKIDPSIPFEVACLVGCGVTTGYGSAVRTADIRPGQDVAIVGVGGVGMSALQGAVNAGARHIFVIEPVEWKRDAALKFGATHVYPDINAALMGIAEVTAGLMAHKVVVTVGELKGEDVDNYMMITAKGGTCVADGDRQPARHPGDAEPGDADPDAEEPAGHHLRRRQPALRHPAAAVDVQGGQAQPRRHGHPAVQAGADQRGLPGHAGRQEHSRRNPLHGRRSVGA